MTDISADIVIGTDESDTTFCAALVVNKDGSTKILRTSTSDCPIKATQLLVSQLQKDVFPLLGLCINQVVS